MKKRVISLTLMFSLLVTVSAVLPGCAKVQAIVTDVVSLLDQEDPLIYGVREAIQEDYQLTYGATFDYFFTNSEWVSFTTDEGVEVVEFTGSCYFRDSYMYALIQFTITEDGLHFRPTYLSLNGQTQTQEVLGILLTEAFDAYDRSGK